MLVCIRGYLQYECIFLDTLCREQNCEDEYAQDNSRVVLMIGSYIIDVAKMDPRKTWNGMREDNRICKIVQWKQS